MVRTAENAGHTAIARTKLHSTHRHLLLIRQILLPGTKSAGLGDTPGRNDVIDGCVSAGSVANGREKFSFFPKKFSGTPPVQCRLEMRDFTARTQSPSLVRLYWLKSLFYVQNEMRHRY